MGAEQLRAAIFPAAERPAAIPTCPRSSPSCTPKKFWTCIPNLPRKQRETAILQKYPAIFIIGIGWTLKDGYPHEMRAADYDDWVTDTSHEDRQGHARPERRHPGLEPGHPAPPRADLHGHPRERRDPEEAVDDVEQLDFLQLPYHQAIVNDEIPLSIGGGIGQSRTLMLLLEKAHLGEVSVTVWPKVLKRNVREEEHPGFAVSTCGAADAPSAQFIKSAPSFPARKSGKDGALCVLERDFCRLFRLRRTSWVGNLHAPVLRSTCIGRVICNRLRLAVALCREPRSCHSMPC